jgi:vacuolar-type H+-ATPase subunit E/Vma4
LGLPDILETIRLEAEEESAALIAAAEDEADRVLARARERAAEEEKRLAGSLDDRLRTERARIVSRGQLEAAQARRAAREEVFQQLLAGVVDRLGEVRRSARYAAVMASLLDEAISTMPEARVIRVDPADSDVVERALVAQGLDLTVELEDYPQGGLVLAAPGRTIDNRLATRLERAGSHLRFVAGQVIPELRGASG